MVIPFLPHPSLSSPLLTHFIHSREDDRERNRMISKNPLRPHSDHLLFFDRTNTHTTHSQYTLSPTSQRPTTYYDSDSHRHSISYGLQYPKMTNDGYNLVNGCIYPSMHPPIPPRHPSIARTIIFSIPWPSSTSFSDTHPSPPARDTSGTKKTFFLSNSHRHRPSFNISSHHQSRPYYNTPTPTHIDLTHTSLTPTTHLSTHPQGNKRQLLTIITILLPFLVM